MHERISWKHFVVNTLAGTSINPARNQIDTSWLSNEYKYARHYTTLVLLCTRRLPPCTKHYHSSIRLYIFVFVLVIILNDFLSTLSQAGGGGGLARPFVAS